MFSWSILKNKMYCFEWNLLCLFVNFLLSEPSCCHTQDWLDQDIEDEQLVSGLHLMIGLSEQLFPIVAIIYSVTSRLNIIINFSVVLKYASRYWQQNFYDSAMKTYHCSFISKNIWKCLITYWRGAWKESRINS